jgi:hypothetical protein
MQRFIATEARIAFCSCKVFRASVAFIEALRRSIQFHAANAKKAASATTFLFNKPAAASPLIAAYAA